GLGEGGRRGGGGWGRRGGWRRQRPAEEQAAEHGVGPARTREPDGHVSRQVPDEVFAVVETRGCLRVENGAGSRIEHVDALRPRGRIPVNDVKRDRVRLVVGYVDGDGKRRAGVPGGRNAVVHVRGFGEGADVGGGAGPRVAALAAGRHLGVARVVGLVVDHVVAVGAVGSLPIALSGGIRFHEDGRCRGRRGYPDRE